MSEYVYATIGGPVANALGEIFLPRCEIVRCRDCRHAIPVTSDPPWLDCTGPLVETWDYREDEPRMNPVEPEGFCHKGERRDA